MTNPTPTDRLTLSRRRFLGVSATFAAAAWLAPRQLTGAEYRALRLPTKDGPVQAIRAAAAQDPIKVQALRDGLFVLSGSGGNVLAVTEADGVLLVDSGIVGAKVAAAVATVSRAPIRQVVNTHWHFDHTDANAWMRERGAELSGQVNTLHHLSIATTVKDWDFTFPAAPLAARPTKLLSGEEILNFGRRQIVVSQYAPAHTDSDLLVDLPDVDVVHLGDTWWNGVYPFIDYSTGGGIDGMIAAAERNLARATTQTIFVPGHGAVGGRTELQRYRDMLVTTREQVASLKQQGRTIEQAVAARPTADFDAAWSWPIIGPAFFTRLIYQGV